MINEPSNEQIHVAEPHWATIPTTIAQKLAAEMGQVLLGIACIGDPEEGLNGAVSNVSLRTGNGWCPAPYFPAPYIQVIVQQQVLREFAVRRGLVPAETLEGHIEVITVSSRDNSSAGISLRMDDAVEICAIEAFGRSCRGKKRMKSAVPQIILKRSAVLILRHFWKYGRPLTRSRLAREIGIVRGRPSHGPRIIRREAKNEADDLYRWGDDESQERDQTL